MNEEGIQPAPHEPGKCAEIYTVQERLAHGDERMTRIETKLDQNNSDTAEVLDILRLGKSFFRVVGVIGDFIKWGAAIAAPLVALYFTFKDHK